MRADLHMHSTFSSDGKSSVEALIEEARRKRFKCIAITDHNSFESWKISSRVKDMIIVPGIEISSKKGHILAYGIDREISKGLSVSDTIDLIHDAGGIAVASHPYRWWSGLGEKNVVPEFDAIEGINGRSIESSNAKGFRLAANMGKPITGGSDAHDIGQLGSAYVTLPTDLSDWHDVIKAILDNQCVIGGEHRNMAGTMSYGFKTITEWMGRGFRKM